MTKVYCSIKLIPPWILPSCPTRPGRLCFLPKSTLYLGHGIRISNDEHTFTHWMCPPPPPPPSPRPRRLYHAYTCHTERRKTSERKGSYSLSLCLLGGGRGESSSSKNLGLGIFYYSMVQSCRRQAELYSLAHWCSTVTKIRFHTMKYNVMNAFTIFTHFVL